VREVQKSHAFGLDVDIRVVIAEMFAAAQGPPSPIAEIIGLECPASSPMGDHLERSVPLHPEQSPEQLYLKCFIKPDDSNPHSTCNVPS